MIQAFYIESAHQKAVVILLERHNELLDLEDALPAATCQSLQEEYLKQDGQSYQPQVIECPSKIAMLKQLKSAESMQDSHASKVGNNLPACTVLSMGLDLEIKL